MNVLTNFEERARSYDTDPIEAALMDVGRLIQITPTMHQQADDHVAGLVRHLNRAGSPLEGRVDESYPSGSFAIHTATRSRIRREQHDADAVIEVDGILYADPQVVLDEIHAAVKGKPGSRYHDYPIERNSRCVTITYPDGVTVDLMPVARLPNTPDRVAYLFHRKPEAGESYRKEVNPKGFADLFNERVERSATFRDRFDARRALVEGRTYAGMLHDAELARAASGGPIRVLAEAQPMPAFVPLDQKAPRVVALQIIKRFRDKRFRKHDDHRRRRKPPSIVSAAEALNVVPAYDTLFDEVVAIATHQIRRIREAERSLRLLHVTNPAHAPDVFTDRWPATREDQRLWASDLKHLVEELTKLRSVRFDPAVVLRVFDDLFGETVGKFVLQSYHDARSRGIERGTQGMTQDGSFVGVPPKAPLAAPSIGTGVAGAVAAPIRPARANTNMGGMIKDDRHR